jgi:hypothetical protein
MITQGQINATTKVKTSESHGWRPLSEFPELEAGATNVAPSPKDESPQVTTKPPFVDSALTAIVLLSVLWQLTDLIGMFAGFSVWTPWPVYVAAGVAWVALGVRYATRGMVVTPLGRYRKLQSHVAAGVWVVLFGVAIIAYGARSALTPPPKPTVLEVTEYVRGQIEQELGRKPESFFLRPTGKERSWGKLGSGKPSWTSLTTSRPRRGG